MGYKATAGIFSASEVGAPHQRKRVFILAVSNSLGGAAGVSRSLAWNEGIAGESNHGGNEGGRELAYDSSERLSLSYGQRNEPEGQRDAEFECCGNNAWPSRPGEPQHGWEPPRVVGTVPAKLANFCTRDAQSGGDTAQASGESLGQRGEGEGSMPNGGSSLCRGDQGDEQTGMAHTHGGRGEEPEHQHTNLPSEPSWGCAEAMGNASHWSNGEQPTEQQGRHSVGGSGEEGAMGNATSERPHRGGEDGLGLQPEMLGEGYEAMGDTESRRTGGCGNKDSEREGLGFIGTSPSGGMGDTEQLLLPASREHGAMDEASGIPANGKGCESSQADPESSATRKREGYGSNASECSETQQPMGDTIDGTKFGLGLTELSGLSHCELAEIREWMVKTDNRTDELRLLGNGCVPATVSRAFLILLEKLK